MGGWLVWSTSQLLCLRLLLLLHSPTSATLCSPHQASALLHFKQLFTFHYDSLSAWLCDYSSYPKMKNWEEDDTDCCSWHGVTCDTVTGHVTGLDLSCGCLYGTIPPDTTTLSLLPHLQNLNLAFNDFNFSQIPSGFGQFPTLTHLNLSYSNFSGQVPSEISHLSGLVSLDLSGYDFDLTLAAPVMEGLVRNLTELEELVLDGANMSAITPGYLSNLSSSLTLLNLGSCALQGRFPENIFHLPDLHTLDLWQNEELSVTFPGGNNRSSPLKYLDVGGTQISGEWLDPIGHLTSLAHFGMGSCNFIGPIPASIGNLIRLSYLDLSENHLSGHIPSFLSNFEQLTHLDFGWNNFVGEIPDIFFKLTQLSSLSLGGNNLSGPIPASVGELRNLTYIGLYENSLNGTIPPGLFSLPLLEVISLGKNKLSGHIGEFKSNSLRGINLDDNRLLDGPISSSIFSQVNLTYLRLSSNNLSGTVELYMFAKLKNLLWLDLSYNNLSISTTKNKVNSSFPQLKLLALSSCNMNEFPEIISTANQLDTLDLSCNEIHGQIPNWLLNIDTLRSLNISRNYLTGSIERLPWKNLASLDLHSNLLQGSLPTIIPPWLQFFSVSHNKLTGVIPSSFCNVGSLQYLELSNNSLGGMIPQCLGNSSTILVLDLKMNKFHGSIPQTFASGSQLTTLNLNRNQLEGSLPSSLVNCCRLEVLDVGNNMIDDAFPNWLATLSELQVLILRSNRFSGSLGNLRTGLPFPKLRILDLSHNGFTGHLPPKFFTNFQAMLRGKNNSVEKRYMGDDYYQDSVMVTMKGVDFELQKILTIFTAIDLSSNKFEGRIPDVVGKLNSLKVFNFSHNSLTGHIPISMENLRELESLDLSSNMLSGEIPIQLVSLTFISVLNLSCNQLVEPIPRGQQFNTFQNDSYLENSGLCGLPLSKTCSNDEAPESEATKLKEEENTSNWFDWKIIMMGYGSGLVIGLSMGYIVLGTGKPWWFVSIVERKVIKLTERSRRRN